MSESVQQNQKITIYSHNKVWLKIEKVAFLMELKVTFTKVTGKWFVKDKK